MASKPAPARLRPAAPAPAPAPAPGPARVRPGDGRRAPAPPVVREGTTGLPGVNDAIPPRPAAAGLAAWAAALLGQVVAIEDGIAKGFFALGLRLRELAKPEVYRSLGFSSFGSLLESRALMSRYWAIELIRIVNELGEDQARRLGVSRAKALISYAAARGFSAARLEEANARVDGKPVRDMTVRELNDAARRARQRRRALSGGAEHRAALRAVETIRRSLRSRGFAEAHVRVVLRRGRWWVRAEVPAASAVAALAGSRPRGSG